MSTALNTGREPRLRAGPAVEARPIGEGGGPDEVGVSGMALEDEAVGAPDGGLLIVTGGGEVVGAWLGGCVVDGTEGVGAEGAVTVGVDGADNGGP